ncbi:transposase [candidate division WOR-3 bacterium]|nr:transposase [candidate division WOR-3 bacterium]
MSNNITIREKKHRLPREFYQGKISGTFTICIKGNFSFLENQEIVKICIEILEKSSFLYGCIVPVYCFMPDHLHFVLFGVKDDANLWKTVVQFKQNTGFYLKKQCSQFQWQKDFYDHIIRQDENLITQIRYILDNPVRRGLINNWNDYPFIGSIGIKLEDVLQGCL